jgi:hypothetical protein
MFRSLGLRSDALAMRGVSQFEECPVGIIMRTPSEPNYWCGNALIRQNNKVPPDIDIAAFCAAFPDAKHRKILWDIPSPDVVAMRAAYPDGYEVDSYDVLTCQGTAVTRFQSVETCAAHRRRGICAALLSYASVWAADRAPDATQVIVAEADSDAGRLYRSQGFAHVETLVEATHRGY